MAENAKQFVISQPDSTEIIVNKLISEQNLLSDDNDSSNT